MTIVKNRPVTFNNLFDELFGNLNYQTESTNQFTAVNVHETNDAFHIEVSAPGRNKDNFKINADKGLLTISYEKTEEKETNEYKTLRREFSVSNFKRSFNLPENITVDDIKAKYNDGILSVFIPKHEVVKPQPKEITIA